jgi:hypothetical protein
VSGNPVTTLGADVCGEPEYRARTSPAVANLIRATPGRTVPQDADADAVRPTTWIPGRGLATMWFSERMAAMVSGIFNIDLPTSGRSDHERYVLAEMNYPLVAPAVSALMRRHGLSEARAFAVLEALTTTGLTLDQVSAQVINDR